MAISFSWEDEKLREQAPASLRNQLPLAPRFNAATNISHTSPPLKGRGSTMVKQEQPKPELKPKNNLSQLRKTFKARWQAEYEAAIQNRFEHESDHELVAELKNTSDFPERERHPE